MQAEDRPIHFSTELIHAPAPLKKPALQKLYFDLSQTRTAAYDNTDFTSPIESRFYSRRGNKTQSIALFLPDRVVMLEEWVDMPLATFTSKVRDLTALALPALELPLINIQTVTLRSTFALTHFNDARVFLLDHMCRQEGRVLQAFQRPVANGGLRFVLPETPDHSGNLSVTIESFRYSQSEVFVEVKGIFPNIKMGVDDLEQSDSHFQVVRSFMTNHIQPLLDQYDVPQN